MKGKSNVVACQTMSKILNFYAIQILHESIFGAFNCDTFRGSDFRFLLIFAFSETAEMAFFIIIQSWTRVVLQVC